MGGFWSFDDEGRRGGFGAIENPVDQLRLSKLMFLSQRNIWYLVMYRLQDTLHVVLYSVNQ